MSDNNHMVHFLSRGTQYALRALIHLAGVSPSEACPVRRIAAAELVPQPFLAKLMGRLARAGLVHAFKGPGGGIRLARPPNEVKVIDVILAVEGMDYFEGCFLGLPACDSASPCPMHDEWKDLTRRLSGLLEGVTLAELARSLGKNGPAPPGT